MASIKLKGDTSGEVTISAPAVAGTTTLTLPATSSTLATQNSLGVRNLIINGNFDIWQRGTSFSFSSNSVYTADRFKIGSASGSFARQAFTLGQTEVPYEPSYYGRWTISSNSQNYEMNQRIEDVRSLAGQTATLSFYARRPSGSTTINARIVQYFGTGGSPSSTVVTSLGTVGLTTDWQKFTFTVSVPSISGKTLGTDNNHSIWAGVQITDTNTGTIDFSQIQFEKGEVATPFEHRSYDMELARCMRYFQRLPEELEYITAFFFDGTSRYCTTIYLPVVMRTATQTVTYGTAQYRNGGTATDGTYLNNQRRDRVITIRITCPAAPNSGGYALGFRLVGTWTLDAEL